MSGVFFFFQAEDGIRDLVRSRGLGDVYKRQGFKHPDDGVVDAAKFHPFAQRGAEGEERLRQAAACLLYTSDAADERSSVDLGGRRIIKKKKQRQHLVGTRRINNIPVLHSRHIWSRRGALKEK